MGIPFDLSRWKSQKKWGNENRIMVKYIYRQVHNALFGDDYRAEKIMLVIIIRL